MKTKQEWIEEMAVIGCVRNPQAHTTEECAKCDFKQGQCNAYRHAEKLYSAGYQKPLENTIVLTKEEYQELEDLRLNHAKDLINANKSYEEHIKDIKLEYSNHIKNLKKIIDRQSKDLNSQADRLIGLKEELENKGKETAREMLKQMYQHCFEIVDPYDNDCKECFGSCDVDYIMDIAKQYGVEIEGRL